MLCINRRLRKLHGEVSRSLCKIAPVTVFEERPPNVLGRILFGLGLRLGGRLLLLVDHEAGHGAHHGSAGEHDEGRLEEGSLLERRRILDGGVGGVFRPLLLLLVKRMLI